MSKEKTYRVQEIFNWYKKFENTELRIKGTTKEFDIEIRDKYLPHLLGLQYINDVNSNIKGKRLYSYVKDNNLSDQEILDRIEQNYGPGKREDISNRIETFPDFLKNLENGIIVEKTLSTKMNVNYLIIQNKDDEFYHLGILSGSNGALLVDFENVEDKREKDLLKTYFVESNKEYFKGSNIAEIVKSIEKYDEKEKEYVPFSFDDEKNKSLLKKYYSDKKEKAKEFLEEYLQRKGINTKELFRCISPNHEDKNPSMSFYAKKNKCTCFACGKNYDIFDLVKMEYGLKTFPEQLRKVEEFMKNPDLIEDVNKTIYSKKNISIELGNNIEKNKSISNKKSVLDPNNPNDIERIIKYQNYIKYCMSNLKECDYLTKRGISEKIQKEYHIGYDPNFKYASFNKAIIIPTYYGCLTARNIDDSSKDRLRKLGNAQIFHYDRIKENPGKEFYIVEGEIDALSIAEAGKKAIALGSVNEINLLVNKLKEDKFENKFILMLDNDEIGKKTQEMLYTKLKEIGINVEKSDILGKYKDPNEFLMKDREKFLSLFQEKEKENPWKKKLNNEKSNGIER
ncbi:toprim domain-containing protein [Fusobacterium polymorphum]|uniref:toprim domain-containing protein n=1 Tax=Fusobacterium nucleatum subsp. polymorphum TaxID=76857 RepID=UPI003009F979